MPAFIGRLPPRLGVKKQAWRIERCQTPAQQPGEVNKQNCQNHPPGFAPFQVSRAVSPSATWLAATGGWHCGVTAAQQWLRAIHGHISEAVALVDDAQLLQLAEQLRDADACAARGHSCHSTSTGEPGAPPTHVSKSPEVGAIHLGMWKEAF